jgi:hypothetical protein
MCPPGGYCGEEDSLVQYTQAYAAFHANHHYVSLTVMSLRGM